MNQLDKLLTKYPFGVLTDFEKDSLGFILYKLSKSEISDQRQQAYVIATIKHETSDTYRPIKEYGGEHYLTSKKYYPYIGRGFVQLTWDYNYKKFGDILRIDLLGQPELAQNPEIAWKILELGMTKGLFTGECLSDYFNNDETDFYHARRIINGMDRAELIKEYAENIYKIISVIEEIPEPRPPDFPQDAT